MKRPLRTVDGAKWRSAVTWMNWHWGVHVHRSECHYANFVRINKRSVKRKNVAGAFTVAPCTCSRIRSMLALYRKPFKESASYRLMDRDGVPVIKGPREAP
jgi:hypothetical protein